MKAEETSKKKCGSYSEFSLKDKAMANMSCGLCTSRLHGISLPTT